jgi:hypothetical protein
MCGGEFLHAARGRMQAELQLVERKRAVDGDGELAVEDELFRGHFA